jgi:hypothetical protein
MATTKLNLTRDQLGTFLKDHEQIKQFERLFRIADEVSSLTDTQGIQFNAENAQSMAQDALSQIANVAQNLAINQAITDSKAEEALLRLEQLTKSIDANLTALQAIAMQAMETSAKLVPMVDMLAMAPPPKEYKRSRYGSFYDTTTQVATVINTPKAITLNTTDLSNGVYLGTPTSRIYVDTKGIYNLQTSIQLDKTSGGTAEFFLWFRKNGTDIPDSCSQVRIQGNNAEVFTSLNFFFNLNSLDYIEIMFAVTDLSVELKTFPATAFSPVIPSIIVTVSNNIEGLTS